MFQGLGVQVAVKVSVFKALGPLVPLKMAAKLASKPSITIET